jgi:hypothetical protein
MGVRAECTHIATESNQTIKVELIGASYGGASRELIGTGANWCVLSYDQLDYTDLFNTVVQRGRLDFSYYVQDATDEAILDEIIASGQGEYTLKLYINGSQYWVGEVMLDQLGAQEEGKPYPYAVRLTAKDFTTLDRELFPLEDNRQTIAKIAGRILSETGYGLNIWTHTSWTEENTTGSNDFMRQIYADTRNLREYSKSGDIQITYLEALSRILTPFRVIVRQELGVFTISQWSEYETPSAVLRTVYDTDGDYVSQSEVNTTVSANSTVTVVQGSTSEFKPGYKRVNATYAHRTPVSGIQVPDVVTLDETNTSDLFEQVIEINETDINQRISVNSTAFVNFDEPQLGSVIGTEPKVGVILALTIEAVTSYWNNSAQAWQSGTVTNQFETRSTTKPFRVADFPDIEFDSFVVPIAITTTSLTFVNNGLAGFGTIALTLVRATTTRDSETTYEGTTLTVGSDNNENVSESLAYTLTQDGSFSTNYNGGTYYFGSGPLTSSPGSLRYGTGDLEVVGLWGRRGGSNEYEFHVQNLKEVMDLYRGWNKVMTAVIKQVGYDTTKTLAYNSGFYNAIGGTFDGYRGWWTALVFDNNLVTSALDNIDLGIIGGDRQLITGAYTAARLNSQNALERSGGYSFRLELAASGTVSQLFVKNTLTDYPRLAEGAEIRVVHPITLDDYIFLVAEDMREGSLVIPVVPQTITDIIPAGSFVYTNPGDGNTALLIGRDSIRLIARANSVGVTTQESLGPTSSIQCVLNTRVRAGDDLFLVREDTADLRAFTVGADAGPGLVTLTLDQSTVFDAPTGSYITGSNAQYEAFLQVTPAGVLARAEAISTQNAFAILSAPLSAGTYTSIPVTSVRTLTLKDDTAIGVQDKAGNTAFFTVDGDQNLTGATTTITVDSQTIGTSIGAGASVFQPMWNQTAQLSVQADQIALRVTETEVQTLIDENIGGLLPAENWTFDNTTHSFTTNNVTLTTQATYVEYLATGATPYIQNTTSYDADDNPVVTIRVERVAGTNWGGAFGWSTDGTTWYTQTFIEPSGVDADFQFATIDLTSNANYTGTITNVRLYLGEANLDEFYVDQFTIGKFNPQTEILGDLSTRLTAAEGAITVESDRIDLFTQKSSELNRIAEVNATYSQSSTYTSIALTNTRSGFTVRDNQVLYLVNVDGTFQSVTVNGNQTLTTALAIDSETFATTITTGAALYEAGFTASSRITQQAGQIVLKAEETDGEVTSLALVRLDADVATGSAVTIQGDLVAINDIQITRGVGAAAGVIQTSNFVAGTSGWRIKGDGDAEFNDVTVRGEIVATSGSIEGELGFGETGRIRGGTGADQFSIESSGAYWGVFGGELTVVTNAGIRSETDTSPTEPVVDLNRVSGLTIEQASGNADFTVSITGAVRTKSNLRVDAEIQARGDLRIYDSADESHYSNIVYGASTGDTTLNIPTNTTGSTVTRTVALKEIDNDFSVAQTVPNASANGHALNRITSDGRYGQLTSANTWTQDQSFSNDAIFQNGIQLVGDGANATLVYAGNNTRTFTLPDVGGNRTFALLQEAQSFTGVQTFPHLGIKLNNSGATHQATLQFGTAANRTYTFSGDSGTVWTDGNLGIVAGGQVSVQPNETLEITIGGRTYRLEAEDIT